MHIRASQDPAYSIRQPPRPATHQQQTDRTSGPSGRILTKSKSRCDRGHCVLFQATESHGSTDGAARTASVRGAPSKALFRPMQPASLFRARAFETVHYIVHRTHGRSHRPRELHRCSSHRRPNRHQGISVLWMTTAELRRTRHYRVSPRPLRQSTRVGCASKRAALMDARGLSRHTRKHDFLTFPIPAKTPPRDNQCRPKRSRQSCSKRQPRQVSSFRVRDSDG